MLSNNSVGSTDNPLGPLSWHECSCKSWVFYASESQFYSLVESIARGKSESFTAPEDPNTYDYVYSPAQSWYIVRTFKNSFSVKLRFNKDERRQMG
jgi:hypothetical protein